MRKRISGTSLKTKDKAISKTSVSKKTLNSVSLSRAEKGSGSIAFLILHLFYFSGTLEVIFLDMSDKKKNME